MSCLLAGCAPLSSSHSWTCTRDWSFSVEGHALRGHFVPRHALSLLGPPMRATSHRLYTNSAVPWKAPIPPAARRKYVEAEASRKHGRTKASCNSLLLVSCDSPVTACAGPWISIWHHVQLGPFHAGLMFVVFACWLRAPFQLLVPRCLKSMRFREASKRIS